MRVYLYENVTICVYLRVSVYTCVCVCVLQLRKSYDIGVVVRRGVYTRRGLVNENLELS